MAGPRELTLIVAATSKMGIGLNGTLPWTGLKNEMAYFARVTKRVRKPGNQNAVIMGRKTWESIPSKFQPLKDRTNIVISRSAPEFARVKAQKDGKEDHFQTISLQSGVQNLGTIENSTTFQDAGRQIEKAFIIGGGQIYAASLELREVKRILFTRILDDFECDTFFPVKLGLNGTGENGWTRKTRQELDDWVGEEVPKGFQVEGDKGTRYVFEMWERD